MKVKVIDIGWIGDKSLDLYCQTIRDGIEIEKKIRYRSNATNSSVGKIFESVFSQTVEKYSKENDKVFIIVPCFPITRTEQPFSFARFNCLNSDYLSEIGVSSNQFIEMFEKFIQLKCGNSAVTKINENTFALNLSRVLLVDWMNSIVSMFGTSLVDYEKDWIFSNNPGFIVNMENNNGLFMPIPSELKFKIDLIIRSLT